MGDQHAFRARILADRGSGPERRGEHPLDDRRWGRADGQLPVAEHETPVSPPLHGEASTGGRLPLVEGVGDGDGVSSTPTVEGGRGEEVGGPRKKLAAGMTTMPRSIAAEPNRSNVSCFLVVMVALLVGSRPEADAGAWLWFGGLLVLFTLATTWLAMFFGLLAKTVEGAGAFSYILLLLCLHQPLVRPHRLHDAVYRLRREPTDDADHRNHALPAHRRHHRPRHLGRPRMERSAS